MARRVNPTLPASASVLFGVALVVCMQSPAQDTAVVARAAEVVGPVSVSTGLQPVPLTRGFALSPGDRIDTRGGGRLTIELSDGSIVLVQPGTVLVLKDFYSAGSLRELFEITLGRVRVKINHFAGRPNPYRMNSPTASIAVRGTEFSIEVGLGRETQVMVFDGAVEVTYLDDPGHSILLQAGRGVLVVPGQDFRMLNVAGNRRDDAGRRDDSHEPGPPQQVARNDYRAPSQPDPHYMEEHGQPMPRRNAPVPEPSAQPDTSALHVAALAQIAEAPYSYRYNAFSEPHLDSLENPAYAAEFRDTQVRFLALPSLSGPRGVQANGTPQVSMFAPAFGDRLVVGGSASLSTIGALSNVNGNFFAGSAIAALKLDAGGRSSIGFEVERWAGSVSMDGVNTGISQTRYTLGFSQALGRDQKLGVSYRTGVIDANGRSSEISIRLRGALTRRLFYGIAGSWMTVSLDQKHAGTDAGRATAAFGIGYLLNSRTILSADFAVGRSRLGAANPAGQFISLQGATQRDISRRLFVTASILGIGQRYPGDPVVFPAGMGRTAFSDYGIGWRFSREFFVQYLASTNYVRWPSHLMMIRYTFHSSGE